MEQETKAIQPEVMPAETTPAETKPSVVNFPIKPTEDLVPDSNKLILLHIDDNFILPSNIVDVTILKDGEGYLCELVYNRLSSASMTNERKGKKVINDIKHKCLIKSFKTYSEAEVWLSKIYKIYIME